jgi:hypothetical protein
MHHSAWLVATLTLGASGLALPVYADSLKPLPQRAPTMEAVVLPEAQRTVVLNRLADEINRQLRTSNGPNPTLDAGMQFPLIDGLLDQDGDLNLPLGLRVYDAMGTTSVGFGSKF